MVDYNAPKRQDRAGNGSSVSSTYEKELHCWTSLRAIFGMMIPCCGCQTAGGSISKPVSLTTTSVTGTIFGQRKGRVNFCFQEDPASPPLLLLEFATPTHVLVKEMQSGLLRITLECEKKSEDEDEEDDPGSLLAEPVWSMYCNGRKVGFAIRKQHKDTDPALASLMSLMQSVSTGAGVLPVEGGKSEEDELIYMRATYERVVGSSDSEAFHMINPDGTPGQELSIFLNRT